MNKKGFTLMELLAAIVIVGVILMIIFPEITKISNKNSNEQYETYEKMMVEYAMVSSKKSQNVIKLSQLEELTQVKNECKGYVTIDHSQTPNVYKAYISCGNKYKTTGYNASYE